MRCPSCGSDNISASGSCQKCGKPLIPLRGRTGSGTFKRGSATPAPTIRSDANAAVSYVDHRDIPLRLKFEYSHTLKDQIQKALESIQELLAHFTRPVMDVN